MRQNNAGGFGVGEGLRTNLAKFRMRVGRRRPAGRADLAGGPAAQGPPADGQSQRDCDTEAVAKPTAIVRREGLGSARSVSSSELGIIILTAAAIAAVCVFMVLVSVP